MLGVVLALISICFEKVVSETRFGKKTPVKPVRWKVIKEFSAMCKDYKLSRGERAVLVRGLLQDEIG